MIFRFLIMKHIQNTDRQNTKNCIHPIRELGEFVQHSLLMKSMDSKGFTNHTCYYNFEQGTTLSIQKLMYAFKEVENMCHLT